MTTQSLESIPLVVYEKKFVIAISTSFFFKKRSIVLDHFKFL